MSTLRLATVINAPIERVFDLSRSIDLHQQSIKHTNEKAVAGKLSGLINKGEFVRWEAKHFFKPREMKVLIIKMELYTFFEDVMIEGDFKSMSHRHYFTLFNDSTIMTDEFIFESPYGIFGKMINFLFLTGYMKKLLQKRNLIIKEFAETDQWKSVLTLQ